MTDLGLKRNGVVCASLRIRKVAFCSLFLRTRLAAGLLGDGFLVVGASFLLCRSPLESTVPGFQRPQAHGGRPLLDQRKGVPLFPRPYSICSSYSLDGRQAG